MPIAMMVKIAIYKHRQWLVSQQKKVFTLLDMQGQINASIAKEKVLVFSMVPISEA